MLYEDQYFYCINPNDAEPIMLLLGGIGEWDAVSGSIFSKELYCLDALGKERIKIIISSTGGSVLDGQMIYNAIRKINTPVDTYCAGQALSIAAVIFLAGENRCMADYSVLLIHNPWSLDGVQDEYLDMIRKSLIKMIAKDNGNEAEIEEMMNRETTIDAEECLRIGFATEIEKTSDKTKEIMDSKKDSSKKQDFANLILNKFVDKIKTKNMDTNTQEKDTLTKEREEILKFAATMNKVTDKVKAEKDEDMDTDEDDDCKDEMKTVTIDTPEVKDAMEDEGVMDEVEGDDIEDKKIIVDLQNKIKELSDELAKIKNEKEAAEKEAKMKKIDTTIRSFVMNGKIVNDEKTITLWKTQAEKDYDATVALLDGIKGTKVANKFKIENQFGSAKINTPSSKQARIAQEVEMMRKAEAAKKEKPTNL